MYVERPHDLENMPKHAWKGQKTRPGSLFSSSTLGFSRSSNWPGKHLLPIELVPLPGYSLFQIVLLPFVSQYANTDVSHTMEDKSQSLRDLPN